MPREIPASVFCALFFSVFFLFVPNAYSLNIPVDMVLVEGGCFDMGDVLGDTGTKGYLKDERPIHRVCLDDFYLDKTEVTNKQFEVFKPDFKASRELVYEGVKVSPGDNHPVVNINWEAAYHYCKSVSKRLATEAEWEYAAREGGKSVRFGNGKDFLVPDEVNFDPTDPQKFSKKGKYRGGTVPVASFPPNKLGLYDMSGNVWEWLSDWYDPGYYKNSPEKNPKGPQSGPYINLHHVIRGGSWYFFAFFSRAASRGIFEPWQNPNIDFGIRCARSKPAS